MHEFLVVAPHVANTITHKGGKPAGWTPLQCMVDNPFKWFSYSKEDITNLEHMVFDLVRKMDMKALRNQTASHYSISGGGLTALHQLASRNSEHLLFHVMWCIESHHGKQVVIGPLMMPDSLGRGVVDMALACSVELATHLQRHYAPADALLPNPKWAKAQAAKASGRVEQEYWDWDAKAATWLKTERKWKQRTWEQGDSDKKYPRFTDKK